MIEPYCPMSPSEIDLARAFQDWLDRGGRKDDELESAPPQMSLFNMAPARAADPERRAPKAVR